MSRRRSSAQIRSSGQEEIDENELPPLRAKNEDDDAEFVRNLKQQFQRERGISENKGPMTFSQLSVSINFNTCVVGILNF